MTTRTGLCLDAAGIRSGSDSCTNFASSLQPLTHRLLCNLKLQVTRGLLR